MRWVNYRLRVSTGEVEADGVAPTDAELLALADTDAHAFRVLYDRHAESVHGYFCRRGVGHHTAVDLTAETFAEAWRCRHRFEDRSGGTIAPWLFGIARYALSHAARSRAVATAARERLAMMTGPAALDEETEMLLDRLNGFDPSLLDGLESLPAESQHAVEARIIEGHSYESIAERLNCTPLAVRIRVSRALTTLRNSFEQQHIATTGETA